MVKRFEEIMHEEFFLHDTNDARMPKTTSRANLELSFALVEESPYEILGWVMLTPSNIGALQVAASREEDQKRLEKLQTLQGCQLLDIWAKNYSIRAELIKVIPQRLKAWNDKYQQKIAYFYMEVVADNSSVKTEKIELDATGSFEHLEDAYKKAIVYRLLEN